MDKLSNDRFLPYTLKKTASDIYTFTSSWGNHVQTSRKNVYQPGKYAAHGNICFLLELFAFASQSISNLSKSKQ
jgi:hypothetical protein